MRLHGDSYFIIGSVHANSGKPCQDYADVSDLGTDGRTMIAVVSDGCSSGARTDIGARVMALSVLRNPKFRSDRIAFLENSQRELCLRRDDLLATRVNVCIRQDINAGEFHIEGDGVIALKLTDGTIRMSMVEWNLNTPYYPAYQLNSDDHKAFMSIHSSPEPPAVLNTVWDSGAASKRDIYIYEGMRGVEIPFALTEVEYAAVFSDGITQIDGVDWKDAVREFLNFKTNSGEFVKRRMMFGIKAIKAAGSKGPMDDISCAVIHLDRSHD